jgi:selenocysteine-specific translation elongation factor
MDGLAERGTVLLGGPLGGDVNTGDVLLVVSADDEATVRAPAADP